MNNPLYKIIFILIILMGNPALAQDMPVVYSQTVIGIVPGSTVPKAITQSPALRIPAADSGPTSESGDSEAMLDAVTAETLQLRVQVRPEQIPLDRGLYTHYRLDAGHGVLTYFSQARERHLLAENIQSPLDVLFIRDDGIVAQIVPEIVLAYLPEDIGVDFPVRALLFMQAGLAAEWDIQPGYRIEHGMFNPKPLIYRVEESR